MNDPKQNQFEEWEAYLQGDLTGAALSSMEKRLATDPEFAVSLQLHRDLATAISTEKEQAKFQEILKEESASFLNSQEAVPQAKIRKMSFLKWGIAATILLLIAAYFVLNQTKKTEGPSGEELFAQAYEAPVLMIDERSSQNENKKYEAAFKAYDEKNYQLAAKLFSDEASPDQKSEIKYFTALSFLSTENADIAQAIKLFDEVSRDENSIYQAPAKWYLALAILKIGDKNVAKKLLEEIAATGPMKFEKKAKALLEQY